MPCTMSAMAPSSGGNAAGTVAQIRHQGKQVAALGHARRFGESLILRGAILCLTISWLLVQPIFPLSIDSLPGLPADTIQQSDPLTLGHFHLCRRLQLGFKGIAELEQQLTFRLANRILHRQQGSGSGRGPSCRHKLKDGFFVLAGLSGFQENRP